jgi:hypothetical protein
MKKYFVTVIIGLAVFALSAFAANLTVNAGTLQAGQDGIGSCSAPDITVRYGEPDLDLNDGNYYISEILLDHGFANGTDPQAACQGFGYRVTITGGEPAVILGSGSGTFGGTVEEAVQLDTPFDAQQSTDVHVIVGDLPDLLDD